MSSKTEIAVLHFVIATMGTSLGFNELADGRAHVATTWFIVAGWYLILSLAPLFMAFKAWRHRRRERRRALRMIAGALRCVEEWKREGTR
jgi:uncharacterized membrane protein YtjA (UPF0391 family)